MNIYSEYPGESFFNNIFKKQIPQIVMKDPSKKTRRLQEHYHV